MEAYLLVIMFRPESVGNPITFYSLQNRISSCTQNCQLKKRQEINWNCKSENRKRKVAWL